MSLEEGLQFPNILRFEQQFTGLADPSVLVEIGNYFGKDAKVLFDKEGTGAAWLGCSYVFFYLGASLHLNKDFVARGMAQNSP